MYLMKPLLVVYTHVILLRLEYLLGTLWFHSLYSCPLPAANLTRGLLKTFGKFCFLRGWGSDSV